MRSASPAIAIVFLLAGCSNPGSSDKLEGVPLPSEDTKALPSAAEFRLAPLPAGDTFQSVVGSLKERADKGDGRAACQLAQEIGFCRHARARLEAYDRASAIVGGDQFDHAPEFAPNAAQMRYCADADAFSLREEVTYWRRAAESGHIPSIIKYASGSVFDRSNSLELIKELDIYRTSAMHMMERAARSGSVDAHLAIGNAYSPVPTPTFPSALLPQTVLEKDPVKATAHFRVANTLSQSVSGLSVSTDIEIRRQVNQLAKLMTPTQASEADRLYELLLSEQTNAGRAYKAEDRDDERAFYAAEPERQDCADSSFVSRL